MNPGPLWRVFPWDPDAAEGERFSAAFIPGGQGRYRFDLPGTAMGVIYLAETEEHAVAEMIQAFRNSPQPLTDDDLTVWGRRYAMVSVSLAADVWAGIEDLCDPAALTDLRITAVWDDILSRGIFTPLSSFSRFLPIFLSRNLWVEVYPMGSA